MERNLNLNGCDTYNYGLILKWGVSVVFITNALRYTPCVRVVPPAYGVAMTVNELHVFLSSQLKQERERKIERLGKRQALYTRLYFPRGFRSRKWPSCAAICGVRDTAYFRRCASSSLGLFFTGLCGVVACRFPSLSIPRSLFLVSSL